MSTNEGAGTGLVDLEKELQCSVCTEILYQPLTLLDCLHTFCGFCLKEWFSSQDRSRRSSNAPLRFTCPSCRAVVRETRRNATVTTLLDMFLAANPDRVKSAAEKEEIGSKYDPSDTVFPKPAREKRDPVKSDASDSRYLQEVRQVSLEEQRSRAETEGRSTENSRRTRRIYRARHERPSEDDYSGDASEGQQSQSRTPEAAPYHAGQSQAFAESSRRVGHQSSLRSLLSLPDTEIMEEEILRQISEEGLLDGVDLNNLDPAQEEELSERIADAYRQRHTLRPWLPTMQNVRERGHELHRRPRSRAEERSPMSVSPETQGAQPSSPVPRLLNPSGINSNEDDQEHLPGREGSRSSSLPVYVNLDQSLGDMHLTASRPPDNTAPPLPRTSIRQQPREEGLNIPRTRRATESDQRIVNRVSRGQGSRGSQQMTGESEAQIDPPLITTRHTSLPRSRRRPLSPGSSSSSSLVPAPLNLGSSCPPPSPDSSASFVEPSISCDRCGRRNIQYEVHKNCPRCNNGGYNVCIRCYRLDRGCVYWSGFQHSAEAYFAKVQEHPDGQPSTTAQTPHVMISVKFSPPSELAYRTFIEGKLMTNDNPVHRRQTGLFCDICESSANSCFWKCSECNKGDWGFCSRCVDTGHCCTHSLLPMCRISRAENNDDSNRRDSWSTIADGNESFKVLAISTSCDICTYPIPASTTRFHCIECNHGDYDICTSCYFRLVAAGKVSKEDGHNGWRRCLKGHRMVVVGFEDHVEGQKRVVVRNLVGGRAMKDKYLQENQSSAAAALSLDIRPGDWSWNEGTGRKKKASRIRVIPPVGTGSSEPPPTSSLQSANIVPFLRFPPDGGEGLIVRALWSWYPDGDVQDELMFPRGAEITEAENINDDWFWGCYAGRTGLFPGTHIAVVAEIV